MARATKKAVAKPAPVRASTRSKRPQEVIVISDDDDTTSSDMVESTEKPAAKRAKKSAGAKETQENSKDIYSSERCLNWFRNYAVAPVNAARTPRGGKASKSMGEFILQADGMEKLYNAVGVDPSDILALILSQKLGVTSIEGASVAQFQWLTLMGSLSCDSDAKLRKLLPDFRKEYASRSSLLRLCEYVFKLAKKPDEKAIGKDIATELFSMMLKTSWSAFPVFAKFLTENSVRGVTLDTFSGMCDFALKHPSVSVIRKSYDASQAWPSMADDFTEWLAKHPGVEGVEDDLME